MVVPVTTPVWQAVAGTIGFLGVGGYFVYAGLTVRGATLDMFGRELLGEAGLTIAFLATGCFFLLCFLAGALGVVRRLGGGQRIELDSNRITMIGLTPSGAEKTAYLRDVNKAITYKIRGHPMLEIRARDGTKLQISSVLFADSNDFEDLRLEFEERLAATGPSGIAALGKAQRL